MSIRKRLRCPHVRVRGIYGDEIIFATPRFSRLQCLDCGSFLDGPVSISLRHIPGDACKEYDQ